MIDLSSNTTIIAFKKKEPFYIKIGHNDKTSNFDIKFYIPQLEFIMNSF